MGLTPDALTSKRFYVTGQLDDAMEFCYSNGWTDGLPVVPPTEDKVLKFLEFIGRDPSDIVGVESVRGRVITAEKIAISATMAGCLPEYMPVVLAAVECMVDPAFNLHGSSASTSGSAPLLVINGPIRRKLGFNSGFNLFGPGPNQRANATVGRAIRLLLINVLENHPGILDRSTVGHPGKFSYCIAEDEEHSPWEPLHVERGFRETDSTVTVFPCLGPTQLEQRRAGTPEMVLTAVADTMLGFSHGHGEILLIMPPEYAAFFRDSAWSKAMVREYLFEKAQRTREDWAKVYRAELPVPGTECERIPVCSTPNAIVILAAGGQGGPWPTLVPRWSRGNNAKSITRKINVPRAFAFES